MKIFKKILIGLMGLVIIGFLYEQASQAYFNSKRPDSDKFVSIDGIKIHFQKKGNGGPTIVFQSGLGGDHKIWQSIQDSLSQHYTTLSYDRSGLQWSDISETPKTLESFTSELESLLEQTNCPKPYILIGHSLAGLTLRPFIKKHSKDILGVVFLDVSHPLQMEKSSEELQEYLVVPPTWLVGTLVNTGLARVYFSFSPFIKDIPSAHFMNRHIRNYFYMSYKTILREAREDDSMFKEAAAINSFGNIPLTIITGSYPNGAGFLGNKNLEKEYLDIHFTGQKDLLNLSSKSKQIMAPNSGHYVPLTDEKIVIDAIKELADYENRHLNENAFP